MEGFASKGGMLPEQIWDEEDLPEAGMYLGRPSGSAMPLVWAHAEYIKLLRSAADGQPFDLIPIVAERYLAGAGRKDLEIWKPGRQVRHVDPGHTLRIQAPQPFRLHWSIDGWQTVQDTESKDTGLGINFVDLPVRSAEPGPIRFTFFWQLGEHWEEKDYEVGINQAHRDARSAVQTATA
jgi:glucoamylase